MKKVNGSAGCGKTTHLVNRIKSLVDNKTPFIVLCPTHRACSVITNKLIKAGINNVSVNTLHSVLYTYVKGALKGCRKVKQQDPETGKFIIDPNTGKIATIEEPVYEWDKKVKDDLSGIILIDESSMIHPEIWYDLNKANLLDNVEAYGDEKQLPPIIDDKNLESHLVKYKNFWNNYTSTVSLTKNYRQVGPLKYIVDAISESLFSNNNPYKSIPEGLSYGGCFTRRIFTEHLPTLLNHLTDADQIITPYNQVRNLVNTLIRQVKQFNNTFSVLPVIGDRLILNDNHHVITNSKKELVLSKKTQGVVVKIYETNQYSMCIQFLCENGKYHDLNISTELMTKIKPPLDTPTSLKVDYAYAITVHASQGSQWAKVVYLDSPWPSHLDADKLRYVATTRADTQLIVYTCVDKTPTTESPLTALLNAFINGGK